jgi:hypothetical protein
MHRPIHEIVIFLISAAALGIADHAAAWGERGHNLVARIAARLVNEQLKGDSKNFGATLLRKEHMLGHLANVPDIVWRNGSDAITKANAPTHYIDLEYIDTKPSLATTPRRIAAAASAAKAQKKTLATDVGTAPWRIGQLAEIMAKNFATLAQKKDPTPAEIEDLVNQALVAGGTMAHFVGDLGQPLHTTVDYDGWDANQGGIHRYFEDDVVDALSLNFDHEAYAIAAKEQPFSARVVKALKVSKKFREKMEDYGFALALDSYTNLSEVRRLDREVAVRKPSQSDPLKLPAERQPAQLVADSFRELIAKRIATAADALAAIWIAAWREGGSPSLEKYRSFKYQFQPEFIAVDYLP